MRPILPTLALSVALALPAVAHAQGQTNAPPGNSGITQYVEVVPNASGGKPSKNVRSKANRSPLSARQQKQLAASGADGQQLSQVVAGTSPSTASATPAKKPAHPSKKKAKKPTRTTADSTSSQLKDAAAVAAAFSKSDGGGGGGASGIGVPLIALMALSALLVGAMTLLRRRGGAGPGGPNPEPEL
jgi:hypothetical protein